MDNTFVIVYEKEASGGYKLFIRHNSRGKKFMWSQIGFAKNAIYAELGPKGYSWNMERNKIKKFMFVQFSLALPTVIDMYKPSLPIMGGVGEISKIEMWDCVYKSSNP